MFEAKTELFEGPLDLLLHLIGEHKLDILELDIDILATQYLLYLEKMQEHHLELESEYLVMLATLIEIKSKKLLPQKQNESAEEEDLQEVLVRRLLEYQRYKEVAEELNNAFQSRQQAFAKTVDDSSDYKIAQQEKLEGNPYDLLKAMKKVLRRMQLAKPLETQLRKREISLEERQLQLKVKLKEMPERFGLYEYLDDVHDNYEFVISFLAILEFVKEHILVFHVDDNEDIWFKRGNAYV